MTFGILALGFPVSEVLQLLQPLGAHSLTFFPVPDCGPRTWGLRWGSPSHRSPQVPGPRGRRQGRQPLNPAMPRRVVWEAKHSFSYPGARPCRRPSPKILQPAGVFTFLGVRGGKKEGKIWRCVLEVLVGRFLVDFWSFFLFFWYCPRVKIV